jgi:hypothetical protein
VTLDLMAWKSRRHECTFDAPEPRRSPHGTWAAIANRRHRSRPDGGRHTGPSPLREESIALDRILRIRHPAWLVAQALIGLLILTACQSDDGGANAAAESGGGETTDVFDLAEGDCFSAVEGKEVTEVEVVSCDQPHVFEVFHVFHHPAGGDEAYPGDSEISTSAEEECIGAFEEFVGIAYEESRWFLTTITPSEETWSVGDREIVCTLSVEDESEVTGSAQGTAE